MRADRACCVGRIPACPPDDGGGWAGARLQHLERGVHVCDHFGPGIRPSRPIRQPRPAAKRGSRLRARLPAPRGSAGDGLDDVEADRLAPGQQRAGAGRGFMVGTHVAALQEKARRVGQLHRVPKYLQPRRPPLCGQASAFRPWLEPASVAAMRLSRRALLLAAGGAPLGVAPVRAESPPELLCPLAEAPTVLIPGVSNSFATRFVGGKIYRGLMRWGPEGTLQPDLASAVGGFAGWIDLHCSACAPTWSGTTAAASSAADVVFSLTRFHAALQPSLRLERLRVEAARCADGRADVPAASDFSMRLLDGAVAAGRAAARARRAGLGAGPATDDARRHGSIPHGELAAAGAVRVVCRAESGAGRDRLPGGAEPGEPDGAGGRQHAGAVRR